MIAKRISKTWVRESYQLSMPPFELGWLWGQSHGEVSMQEAEEILSGAGPASIDQFCQGSVDGANNDTFRLQKLHTARDEA